MSSLTSTERRFIPSLTESDEREEAVWDSTTSENLELRSETLWAAFRVSFEGPTESVQNDPISETQTTPSRSPESEILFSGGKEQWPSLHTIDARIVHSDGDVVTMECLVDPTESEIELREFDIELLEGVVPIEYHQYVVIRILKRPGKVCYTFSDGSKRRQSVAKLFSPRTLFEGLRDEDFNDEI